MEREALKLALEALRNALDKPMWNRGQMEAAITAIKEALAQPAQEPEMLTIVYQSGYYDGKQAALAGREWNFCERCGKRTADKTVIHTCTPPQGDA
jgi:regulator of replication initiation timing